MWTIDCCSHLNFTFLFLVLSTNLRYSYSSLSKLSFHYLVVWYDHFFVSNTSLHGPLNLAITIAVLVNAVSLRHFILPPPCKANFAWNPVLSEVSAHYSVHAWHLWMIPHYSCQPENQWNMYIYIYLYMCVYIYIYIYTHMYVCVYDCWFPSGVGIIIMCLTNQHMII